VQALTVIIASNGARRLRDRPPHAPENASFCLHAAGRVSCVAAEPQSVPHPDFAALCRDRGNRVELRTAPTVGHFFFLLHIGRDFAVISTN
jgi:hypothetical protein